MATKLSEVLQQESSGIMFPFKTSVKPITTEQKVYSPTDGIMSVTGKAYEGPDAVVKYGTPEQSYQRQLKQIEGPMLPQFDQTQFPKAGEGRVEAPPLPPTTPVTPIPEQPKLDPCPPGFKLVDGVCRPIKRDTGGDRPTFTGPKISNNGLIEGYTHVLDRAAGSMESGALNSIKMQQIEDQYGVAMSSKIGEINQKYRNRGVQIKLIDNAEVNRLKNIYGQSRVDEDFTQDKDGNYYRIVATSPKAGEALQDAVTAIGDVMEDVSIINIANKVLGGDDKKEDAPTTTETKTQVKEETTTDRPTEPATGDTRNFGQLDSGEFTSFNKSIEYFGQLNRDKDVLQMEIDAINQMLQGQNLNLPRVKAKFKDSIDKRNRSEKKLKDIENEIKQAEDDARQTSEKLAASDREAASKIASDYNSRVNERAEKRRKESEARRKAEATKTTEQRQSEKEQRSSNFRKMSRDIASFRDKFRR
jgi:hypothetical protein